MESRAKSALIVVVALVCSATAGYLLGGRGSGDRDLPPLGHEPAQELRLPATGGSSGGVGRENRAVLAKQQKLDLLGEILGQVRSDLVAADWDSLASARAMWRLAQIRPEDVPLALEWLGSSPGGYDGNDSLTDHLLAHWARTHGELACEFSLTERLHGWQTGPRPVRFPLLQWAGVDPQAAFAWFLKEDAAGRKGVAIERRGNHSNGSSGRWVFQSWVQVDLEGAIAALDDLSPEHRNVAAQGFALGGAAVEGRTALLDAMVDKSDWMTTVSGPMERMFGSWVHYRPAELAEWVDGEKGRAWGGAPHDLMRAWIGVDPAAASEWWMGREVETPRARHVEQMVFAWSITDPFAAAEWLSARPLDDEMAPAMKTLAQRVASADADAAIAWAGRIADPDLRLNALEVAAKEAARWSNSAANAAVDAADLDSATRARLLEQIKDVEEVR